MSRTDSPAPPERRLKTERGHKLLLGTLLALTLLLGCFPMSDFDVWWHLCTARLILHDGAIPHVDVVTYTNAGRPWIDLYWLFQLTIALLYKVGGATALVAMKALAGTAMVALALRSRRPRAPAWIAALVWLPALVAFSGRLCERPELFSLLFLCTYLVILSDAASRPRRLWLLPVVQVLWVNCHGFFVMGPLVLGAYACEVLYNERKKQPERNPPRKTLLLSGLATLLACVASPYGIKAVTLPIEQFHKLGDGGLYQKNIGEFKTLGDFISVDGFKNPYLLSVVTLFALGVVSFTLELRRRELHPFRLILFVAASYLGWQASRNSSLFALVAAMVTCWNLDHVVEARGVPAENKSRKRRPPRLVARPRNWNGLGLAGAAVLGALVLSGGLYAWAGEGRSVGLGERSAWFAHGACAFLAESGPERIVAFNLGQAAVCMAHASPGHKLFIDPRLEVNSVDTFERYLTGLRRLWRGQPDWEAALGIDYARPDELPALLIERGVLARAADMLARDPRWRCVYADAVAVVFVPTAFAETHHLVPAQR